MSAKKTEAIGEKLTKMIGKEYLYRGRNVIFKKWEIANEAYKITTDGPAIYIPITQISTALESEFLDAGRYDAPVVKEKPEQVEEPKQPELKEEKEQYEDAPVTGDMVLFKGGTSNLNLLEGILMDNIKQLKTDKKFLDQAKEINSHAGNIIKIAKTKVDMAKEIRKINSLS